MDETFAQHRFNIPVFLLSTVISILSVHSSLIEKPLLKWLNKQTGREKDLLQQKLILKNEQESISMVDHFARYSKIQRQINSVDQELQEIKGNKPTNSFFTQLVFGYGVKAVLVFVLISLSLYYRHTPVFYVGDKISLMPFTNLICYPNQDNYVSFYFWAMSCAAVARLL